ncbi:phosphopantetheine-binding protein [Gorillibacterium timonense]|uniref:phosphopantetheine-binding protein n=1 Tax=Gorillibacterium timonense TaxID=1689269 RepID=UPI00071D45AD|nr:phosphopantetheine-binding protein [Gorillibacterium timonense]
MELLLSRQQVEDMAGAIIIRVMKEEMGLESIASNENFEELGISSLNFIKALVIMEAEFDLEFEDRDLNIKHFQNLGTLADFIWQKLNPS